MVISQGDGKNPVSYYNAVLTDNTIDASSRAAVVLDAVTAELTGNACTNSGLEQGGTAMFSQAGAVVTGADTVFDLVTPLGLHVGVIEIDDLVD